MKMRFFSVLLATACVVGPVPSNADEQPFDVDHLNCGQLVCADVYQGQNVAHPQLIATFIQTGLASPDITFIHDFPHNSPPTFTIRINSGIAMHVGSSPSIPMTPGAWQTLLENAAAVGEGAELAYNNPYTAGLGFWPSMAHWAEIVAATADNVPEGLSQWDIDNGLVEEPEGTGTEGGMSSSAVGGLFQRQTCHQNPSQPGCPSPFDQVEEDGVSSLAAPGPSQAQREQAVATRARLALALEPDARRQAIERLRARIDPQALDGPYDTECSNDQLEAEQSLQTCRDRCDMCETLDMTVDGMTGGAGCGVAVSGLAYFLSGPTEGGSLLALVAAGTTATATCAGAYVWVGSIWRSQLHKSCQEQCSYYFE